MGEEEIIYKIEILQLVESKYNIEIKDEEVENILTLENLIELIKTKTNNNLYIK
jgi:acyl carrier protein